LNKKYCSNNDTLVKVTHSSSALSDVTVLWYFGHEYLTIYQLPVVLPMETFDQDLINYNMVHFQPFWLGPNFH